MLIGTQLIAGQWVDGEQYIENTPVSGEADRFAAGTVAHVETASEAAEKAFWSFGYSCAKSRNRSICAVMTSRHRA